MPVHVLFTTHWTRALLSITAVNCDQRMLLAWERIIKVVNSQTD